MVLNFFPNIFLHDILIFTFIVTDLACNTLKLYNSKYSYVMYTVSNVSNNLKNTFFINNTQYSLLKLTIIFFGLKYVLR